MNNRVFNIPDLPEVKVEHVIGISRNDSPLFAYCLVQKFNGHTRVILSKTMRKATEFNKEVNNLSRYFNAKIVEEKQS